MKKPKIEDIVMAKLYTLRKDIDPNDWQTHIRRNLVHEVRAETVCFYGPTDCLEAQYPGLDYNESAHRMRLSRYACHRRLFRVFDELRLTDNEIQRLCRWEGTRWARETYEANNGVKIKDTTWDGIVDARHRRTTATRFPLRTEEKSEVEAGELADNEMEYEDGDEDEEVEDSDEGEEVSEIESEDEVQQSVGVELNQRLLAATEARARGENATLDADWEQWLKEAAERGTVPNITQGSTSMPPTAPQSPVYWGREIPEYLSDNPTPEIASIQARLPPPPQYYFPRTYPTSPLAAAASVPPPTPSGGAAL